MEIANFISDIYNLVSDWIVMHGVRVVLVLLAAVAINFVLRIMLSRKKFAPIPLDNNGKPKYREIIGKIQKQRIQTVVHALNDTLSFLVYVIAILMILPEVGVNVAPILAGLGLAGLAIGMAAKDILTNFLAGFFIILEGEYNIGDEVEVAGIKGKVLAISLRRTILRDGDGAVYLVPNGEVKLIKRLPNKKIEETASKKKEETKVTKN